MENKQIITFNKDIIVESGALINLDKLEVIKIKNCNVSFQVNSIVNCPNLKYIQVDNGAIRISKFSFTNNQNFKYIHLKHLEDNFEKQLSEYNKKYNKLLTNDNKKLNILGIYDFEFNLPIKDENGTAIEEPKFKYNPARVPAQLIYNSDLRTWCDSKVVDKNDKHIFKVACDYKDFDKLFDKLILNKNYFVIESYAFHYCDNLEHLNIPEGITHIEKYAFAHCKNLKSVILPSTIKSIEYKAFYDCPNLELITTNGYKLQNFLPSTLENLSFMIFHKCPKIHKLIIPYKFSNYGPFISDNEFLLQPDLDF